MTLLQTFINDAHSRPSLAIFQSSAAQTTIPVLRQYLATSPSKGKPRHRILFSLLYLPSDLVGDANDADLEVHDWLDNVPGYSEECFDPGLQLLSTLDQGVHCNRPFLHKRELIYFIALNAHLGAVDAVVDSIDTLFSDLGSLSEAYKCLHDAHTKVAARPGEYFYSTESDLAHPTRVYLNPTRYS